MDVTHRKKFPSFDDAVKYCESRGKMKYFGRVGYNHEKSVYTLYRESKTYYVSIRDDGLVEVTGFRYGE